jgi:hypothetical protein
MKQKKLATRIAFDNIESISMQFGSMVTARGQSGTSTRDPGFQITSQVFRSKLECLKIFDNCYGFDCYMYV